MRTIATAAVLGGSIAWSVSASAQLAPPAPMQPQQPQPQGWGAPINNNAPAWGAMPQQPAPPPADDSGRGLEIGYARLDAGYSHLAPGFGGGSRDGATLGVAAGARLLYWTLGARFRYSPMSTFDAWQLDGEAGFHVPLGPWDPYGALHGGWANMSASNATSSIHGPELGASAGTDYYFSGLFSVGADATFDVMFLSFAGASSTGWGLSLTAHAGLHFDL